MNQPVNHPPVSPFSIPNVRLFIAFKVFFNSRFYYPVFTILFLDFGLTIAQFSMLNAVWAVSIVLAEVPLGALADIIGRKRLLVSATAIMIIEISIICFVPHNRPNLVFIVFMINRILSGIAEAAASGADEAIAYDSLAEQGNADQWGRVLEILMRFQSIGFILAMSLGAAVYDPGLMTRVCQFFGFSVTLTQDVTMRFPLYLTLLLSFGAFAATLKMTDISLDSNSVKTGGEDQTPPSAEPSGSSLSGNRVKQAFKLTFEAGTWILKTRFALSVILFGMLFDSIIRMVITLASQYYRVIELPESIFGLIGAMVAMLGLIVPKIARKLAETRPVSHSFWITAALTLTGLATMNLFLPWAGIVPALLTFSAMYFNGFFVSYHINQTASSEQRATVLSFKGLAYNISYGIIGIVYALMLKAQKQGQEISSHLQDNLFMESFYWFPVSFVVCLAVLLGFYRFFLKSEV